MIRFISLGIFVAALMAGGAIAQAQTTGPITPPPTFELKHIPVKPEPAAPPIPAEQIIQRFTQNEDLNKKAYDADTLDQSVKVEELVANGGLFELNGEQYTKSDGEHYESVLKPPTSNLHYTEFSLEDVKFLAGLRLFFLTTEELPGYKLSYEGKEKLDQIDTFIFRVQPKQLISKPLFDGVVWIDDQDFAIVKSYGQFVTDTGNFAGSFPFRMFDVYRENIQGHLWLPTYIRSDSDVKAPQGTVPIRLVIRSSNFRPNAAASPAPPTKPAGPGKTR
ncbi:MAG: hypothetical protein WBD87_05880 [Candidatus Acidiferrales bacterium]